MLTGVTVPGVAADDGDGDALLPRWTKASMALAQFPMAGGRRRGTGARRQRLEKTREEKRREEEALAVAGGSSICNCNCD